MKLNLYSVSDKYIKYLRQFEDKIYDNKEEIRTHERKYLGIVLTVNGFNYYIPMSSPKKSDYIDYEKKIIRTDTKTIIRISEGGRLYGTLRISNMIPVPITELEPYILSDENDLKYREVILGELRYINNNSNKIMKYAKTVYKQKIKNIDIGYIKNTVDFKLLEEKLKEWNEGQ
jgi:protein AbiQ